MMPAYAQRIAFASLAATLLVIGSSAVRSDAIFFVNAPPILAQTPLYLKDAVPPLNMLVMGKDHKIYYEAYNDASDLDGDGALDVGYKPSRINYYGYFNSNACYTYEGASGRFIPVRETATKTCGGTAWSGDFLNYLTTSRMDALRRVLYGGWRQVDTIDDTTLQGAFFPQDAHSWGKEYQSVARDGYNISDYAPLSLPAAGRYHLFAVTTLSDNTAPVFRVLQGTDARVWNWLSIEGPVAGNRCFNASNQRVDCVGGSVAAPFPGHPANRGAFDTMESTFATTANRFGSGSINRIDCENNNCNPYGVDDNYLSIIEGQISIRNGRGGTYQFRVDGDDLIDFTLFDSNGNTIASAGCYNTAGRNFGTCGGAETSATVTLAAGTAYRFKFRQETSTGNDGYRLSWQKTTGGNEFGWRVITSSRADANDNGNLTGVTLDTYNLTPATAGGSRTDYNVRVQVCPATAELRDPTCKVYPNGRAKPTGILHDYGENQKMYFGLITGSQFNNLEGGVLRKNISNFANEVNQETGQFLAGNGIANTLSRLRMVGGGYNGGVTNNASSDANWNWANGTGNCPSIGDRAVANGECRMWGNPIAEMMFEGLRYFAGAGAATARFGSGGASQGVTEENSMGLSQETWKNPYGSGATGLGYPTCARPFQTVISDINPSYDSNLPGSPFATVAADAAVPGFNAATEGGAIWSNEFGASSRNIFIGQVGGSTDGAPTAKVASSFGNIRGLAPEEPTKEGTYYAASVARYGFMTDLNLAEGAQRLGVYSIALASPLPRIEFPIGGRTVTLVPFAKTVSGTFGGAARKPTNTIVDFYVERIVNLPGQPSDAQVNGGRPYAVFRINYEDVEQGNDHDMDAIVRYEVLANADNTMTVNLLSEYAAGSANQNMGYIISGTTRDGVYLEVRDTDSALASSVYNLNTPPGVFAGQCASTTPPAACSNGLGFTSTRTFTPSLTAPVVTELRDPLWYAAKYGGFTDANDNNLPDPGEWDKRRPGEPDNYFLVTNPLNLRSQLATAFESIAASATDPGNATVSGARLGGSSFTLQPSFARTRQNNDWYGNLVARAINADGTLGSTLWDAQIRLPAHGARNILTLTQPGYAPSAGGSPIRTSTSFLATNLGATEANRFAAMGINAATVASRYGFAYTPDDIVQYVRGNTAREARNGGSANTLRSRTATLGDIVNSEPVVFSPKGDFGYGGYTDSMFSGYSGAGGYLQTKATRTPIALVGANDGMLHAFNASTVPCGANGRQSCAGAGAGTEVFAVIPHAALTKIGELPLPDSLFQHRYYVDGQVTIADAKSASGWRSIAVAAMAAGGRSVFAVDITNPTAVDETRVLWELNSSVDQDIGHVFGKPLVVPLENGRWATVFGNGYGGAGSDPTLFVVDAFSGAPIRKITANDGATGNVSDPYNGLGQVSGIDTNGNGKVDVIYGGDLLGNMWKFDLRSTTATSWGVAFSGSPLFTATEGPRNVAYTGTNATWFGRQPITGGLRVSAGPGSGVMVYFGTGRYLAQGDNDVPTAPQVQSLYGVWDNGAPAGGRDNLVGQRITGEAAGAGGSTIRTISGQLVSYFGPAAKRGWVLDLGLNTVGAVDSPLEGVGERFIATPRIQNGKVFFPTYSPVSSSCDPGGQNYMYVLDLLTGSGSLAYVKVLPSATAVCTGADCGGIRLASGAPVTSTSAVVPDSTQSVYGLTCTPGDPGCTSGGPPTFEECQVVIYPGALVLPRPCGRQSWRQVK